MHLIDYYSSDRVVPYEVLLFGFIKCTPSKIVISVADTITSIFLKNCADALNYAAFSHQLSTEILPNVRKSRALPFLQLQFESIVWKILRFYQFYLKLNKVFFFLKNVQL